MAEKKPQKRQSKKASTAKTEKTAKKSTKKPITHHAKKVVDKAKSVTSRSKSASAKTDSKKKSKGKAIDNSDKLKVYSNVSKRKVKREQRARKKAEYLATLPKHPVKRFFYRLHPKRVVKYWFSKRGAIMALKITGISAAAVLIFTISIFAYFRRDLPDPNELSNRQLNQTTKFYDRTGEELLFEVFGDQRRTVVGYEDINDYVKQATVAIEDKDFYNHGGFSVSGIVRAAVNNVTNSDESVQGGSTITQQFIKNSLLTNERTVTRKVKELILSIELERLYTKDEILTFYLNEISYGGISYGIEAAAQSYFEKTANTLSLDEAALLAAMPQAPGDYSPYGQNTELLVARQSVVIDEMAAQGYITNEEAAEAKEIDTLKKVVPLEKQSAYKNVKAPHFVELVKSQLIDEYGRDLVENGGLTVTTTIDLELQKVAEDAVNEGIDRVVALGGDNAALSATDVSTGQVLAQVGSRGFFYPEYGTFNAASPELGRQPGSSFKPYAYAEMFKNDSWGPGSVIWDTKTTFGDYAPNNFDFAFPGKMKVRDALGRSRNIPAVKALYIAGVDNTIELARSMGMKSLCSECTYGLSLVLGSGEVKLDEHVHAYSTFARGGVHKDQAYVLKIQNAAGEVIEEWKDTKGEQVLDPQIAYLVNHMLKDDAARAGTFGLGNSNLVVPGIIHGVKTGTTDLSVDGWMMGYSTCLAAGVWVGNHDSTPMNSITSQQTGPIWTKFMANAHDILNCGTDDWERPDGIKSVTIDSNTGRQAKEGARATHTDIFPSWYNPAESGDTQEIEIDSVTQKLATECTPDRAREKVKESSVLPELPESDPAFDSWARGAPYGRSSGSTTEVDDLHKCDDKLPEVSINVTELGGGDYEFSAVVSQGTHDLKTLNFKVNGQIVDSRSISANGTYNYTHTFNDDGDVTVQAEVIDEALYDNTNSQDVTVTGSAGGGSIGITSPSDGSSPAAPVTITWDTDAGADEYRVCISENAGSFSCETVIAPTTSLTPLSITGGNNYSVYVESYNSGSLRRTSSTITFSAT